MISMTTSQDILQSWNQSMMTNYGQPAMALVRGENATVWDADGKKYIDLLAGVAVNSLGHANSHLIEAVTRQLQTLGHTSNFAAHPQVVTLANRLISKTEAQAKVFFCNSGAEANEAAIKISRLTGRTEIVSLSGSFHGRTMGALSVTGQPEKSAKFVPLLADVKFIEPNDVAELKQAVTAQTAALWLEPILGEGGVIPLTAEYLQAAREICDETGALLVLDEVQTGIGRTGTYFAYQYSEIQPDLLLLAKGLGGGLPIGAVLGFGKTGELFQPGMHGSTFGGNPISCAAANAVLDVIEREDLVARTLDIENRVRATLVDCPGVKNIRGRGAMLGIELDAEIGPAVVADALKCGLIINSALVNLIRLVPPLTITNEELSEGLEILKSSISKMAKED